MSDDLDMLAVQRDDRLLDGLGARRPVDWEDAADPVTSLLAALAADVDAAPIPASLDDGVARIAAARRRLLASRVAIAAGITGVVVFASGVAAAVTGDPLAPLAPIRRVIATVAEQVAPMPSKREAVHHTLDGAHDALARGDRDTAAKLLTDAQGQIDQLEDPPPGDLQAKLLTLQQQLGQQAVAEMSEQWLTPSAAASTPAADAGLATSGPTAEASPEPTTTAGPTGTAEPSSDPTPSATQTPPDDTGTPTDEPGSPQPETSAPSPPADASASGSVPDAAPDRPRAPEQVGAASDAAAPARDPAQGTAADAPAADAASAPRPDPPPAPDPAPAVDPAPAPEPAPAPGPAESQAVPDLTEALVTDVVAAAQTVPDVLRPELPVNR